MTVQQGQGFFSVVTCEDCFDEAAGRRGRLSLRERTTLRRNGGACAAATGPMSNSAKRTARFLPIPSVRAKLVPDLAASLHHESNAFQFRDIRDGVARDRNEVRELARFNRADAVLPPEHFRGIYR
jgi:hypothetical protein